MAGGTIKTAKPVKDAPLIEHSILAPLNEEDTAKGRVEWIVRWLQARDFVLTWDKDGLVVLQPDARPPLTDQQNSMLMELWPQVLELVKTRVVN